MEIEELNLPTKITLALKRSGITTIEDLQETSKEDLMYIRLIGEKSYGLIMEALDKYTGDSGLKLPLDKQDEAVSLYECANAHVTKDGARIHCIKGHLLGAASDGTVPVRLLQMGRPLIYETCQNCIDFETMGGHLMAEDRGWRPNAVPKESRLLRRMLDRK